MRLKSAYEVEKNRVGIACFNKVVKLIAVQDDEGDHLLPTEVSPIQTQNGEASGRCEGAIEAIVSSTCAKFMKNFKDIIKSATLLQKEIK